MRNWLDQLYNYHTRVESRHVLYKLHLSHQHVLSSSDKITDLGKNYSYLSFLGSYFCVMYEYTFQSIMYLPNLILQSSIFILQAVSMFCAV